MDTTKKIHYSILAGIIIIAIIGALITGEQTPTGMTQLGVSYDYPYYLEQPAYEHSRTVEDYSNQNMPLRPQRPPAQSYKLEPIDYMRSFFGTTMTFFPENNPCADVIKKYITRLDQVETDRIETFGSGTETDRFLTMLFEEEDKSMGKLTLVKGFNGQNNCRLRYEMSKIVVGISSWSKTMDLLIEIEGQYKGNSIFITKGTAEVSGYDFACSFGY